MSTRKFNFSEANTAKDSETDEELILGIPIDPTYFTKLPKGMEAPIWLRLKTILMTYAPPSPTLEVYQMSMDDRAWNIGRTSDGQHYSLMYQHPGGGNNPEQDFSAELIFQQIKMKNAPTGKAYNVLNLKYFMYDSVISQHINIRMYSKHG